MPESCLKPPMTTAAGVVYLSPLTTMESRNTAETLIHTNQMGIHYTRTIYF
jgi:hypothetical protein